MFKNWSELAGQGWDFHGGDTSGIPVLDPSWTYETKNGGFYLGFFVVDAKRVYLVDGAYELQAVGLEKGDLCWADIKLNEATRSLSIVGNYVVTGEGLVACANGVCSSNFRMDSGVTLPPRVMPRKYEDQVVVQVSGSSYLVFDVSTGKYETIETSVSSDYTIWLADRGGFGITDSNVSLVDIFQNNVAWQTEFPPGCRLTSICCHDDSLYITFGKRIQKIDAENGAIVWDSDLSFIKNNKSIPIGVCDDTFHFTADAQLFGYSCSSADKLWSKQLKVGTRFCIAGDLIFGFDYDRLFACDRYTGEELWTVSEDFKYAYTVKAIDGYLFVNTTTGKLYCYKWDTEKLYHSPAKPE
ncbi:MAG: PQQ-binding-like beta-propeller repeat protein [Aestuariibacter sp.]|nr:PQQ-binding-like beta-propeller repeat protein [Aestuariibacter sp.]